MFQDYVKMSKLGGNDYLRLGSTFHGLHAIMRQLCPVSGPNIGGIKTLDADGFRLECLQTLTGTKFFIIAEPRASNLDVVLHHIYQLYTDYVLKSPFYEPEMPIKCELFDVHLTKLVRPNSQ